MGHADGDLDPVVERPEPRVRIARPDCPEDVGTPASDLPGRFDDFGDAAAGHPEHPMPRFVLGLSDRVSEQTAQEFLELPGAVEPAPRPAIQKPITHLARRSLLRQWSADCCKCIEDFYQLCAI